MWRMLGLDVVMSDKGRAIVLLTVRESETSEPTTTTQFCDPSTLPSVLCELVHEATGSFTLASGGA